MSVAGEAERLFPTFAIGDRVRMTEAGIKQQLAGPRNLTEGVVVKLKKPFIVVARFGLTSTSTYHPSFWRVVDRYEDPVKIGPFKLAGIKDDAT